MVDNSTVNIVVTITMCVVLAGASALDLTRNPVKHGRSYVWFRFVNWFFMGMSYACMFFGRYNIAVANISEVYAYLNISKVDYGYIITAGLWAYAASVMANGMVVDRIGGRKGLILGCFGSGSMNILLGFYCSYFGHKNQGAVNVFIIGAMVMLNNYFQSFGSSAICKVGALWYHVFERGFFSGIFGVIIAFGFFLAMTVNGLLLGRLPWYFVFYIPGYTLVSIGILDVFIVRSAPDTAGFAAIDTDDINIKTGDEEKGTVADAPKAEGSSSSSTSSSSGSVSDSESSVSNGGAVAEQQTFKQLAKQVFTNRIFIILAFCQICIGWCRDGILQWFSLFLETTFAVHPGDAVFAVATGGITLGGMFGSLFAGIVSDLLFNSRRPPVALLGCILLTIAVTALHFVTEKWYAGVLIGVSSLAFSSVHGIVTSTCAMDFAGSGATATAVGMLDGFQKVASGFTGFGMAAIINKFGFGGWTLSIIPAAIGAICLFSLIIKKGPGGRDVGSDGKVGGGDSGYKPLGDEEEEEVRQDVSMVHSANGENKL